MSPELIDAIYRAAIEQLKTDQRIKEMQSFADALIAESVPRWLRDPDATVTH